MSRRRGEFEHRTSIFEGAYRAWSHLGGIDPRDIVSKSPSDLDPLTFPHTQDPRLVSSDPSALHTSLSSKDLATAATASTSSGTSATVPPVLPHTTAPSSSSAAIKTTQDENAATGAEEQIYPYEPLPRSGLAHPFVQAIISPWLGPDAEHEDTQIGLTTLRTWWQHRRKGESTSAKSALGTEKMKSVVDGYTRHFFNLALVLVMQDGEQPPRTLAKRVKEMEKEGMEFPPPKKESRKGSDRFASGTVGSFSAMAAMSGGTTSQGGGGGSRGGGGRRLLGIEGAVPEYSCCSSSVFDLGSTHNGAAGAGAVNFRNGGGIGGGGGGGGYGNVRMKDGNVSAGSGAGSNSNTNSSYGDPTKTPVVFVSEGGDIQIAMSVSGITCGNCVKIIETVLKGVNGQPSPIQGILDAAADRDLSVVLIKIEKSSYAKRIAHEAKESLRMVGYDAVAKEMAIIDPKSGSTLDLAVLRTAFDIVAATDSRDVFDWSLSCTCPDNGVVRNDCLRHSQMNKRIFEAFDERQEQVKDFMGGCGRRYGLACSCGVNCQCESGRCCGPLAATTSGMGVNNVVMSHDGVASENGSCGRQFSNSLGLNARGFVRSLRDTSSMGQMSHGGNVGIAVLPHNFTQHVSANQFFDANNIQATMVQSQPSFDGMSMAMRVPTTPIRTGNSSSMTSDRIDAGERMERNPISAHPQQQQQQQQHLMNDYMRNMNNGSGNFGGYTWKPESMDNKSNIMNHSMFWNSS